MEPRVLAKQLGIQWGENMDHEDVLAEYYRRQGRTGVHCCPDWDFMAIHDQSPEKEACTCGRTPP